MSNITPNLNRELDEYKEIFEKVDQVINLSNFSQKVAGNMEERKSNLIEKVKFFLSHLPPETFSVIGRENGGDTEKHSGWPLIRVEPKRPWNDPDFILWNPSTKEFYRFREYYFVDLASSKLHGEISPLCSICTVVCVFVLILVFNALIISHIFTALILLLISGIFGLGAILSGIKNGWYMMKYLHYSKFGHRKITAKNIEDRELLALDRILNTDYKGCQNIY